MKTHGGRLALAALAVSLTLIVGLFAAFALAQDDVVEEPPSSLDEGRAEAVAQGGALPAVVLLETCLDIRERGQAVPSSCDDALSHEDEIRAAASPEDLERADNLQLYTGETGD